MTISAYGCRSCTPNWKNSARMYGYCAMPTGCCPKMTTCWIIRTCACCSKLVSRPCNATGLSVRCRTSQSAEKCITRLPMSGSSSRKGSALPRYASLRKNTARRKRSESEKAGTVNVLHHLFRLSPFMAYPAYQLLSLAVRLARSTALHVPVFPPAFGCGIQNPSLNRSDFG